MSATSVISAVQTALSTSLGIGGSRRLIYSHYRVDLDNVISETLPRYQMRTQHQQQVDSGNVSFDTIAMQIIFYRYVNPGVADGEKVYTEGAMLTQQQALLSRTWWRTNVAGIREIESGPELDPDVERVGNIISWGVLISLVLS